MPRICPQCNVFLKADNTCPECDYGRKKSTGAVDPDWWRCADTKDGARCGQPGTLATSTKGGGPYFCHAHFPPFRSWNVAKGAPAPGTLEHIRSLTKHVAPLTKPLDFEAQVERMAIQGEAA